MTRTGEDRTCRYGDQIAAMLDGPDVRIGWFESLCDQWLNLRSWNNVSPSLKLYPRYDDLLESLPAARKRSAYLAHLIRENRPVRELIDSDYSFLNQRLANHYGIGDGRGPANAKGLLWPGCSARRTAHHGQCAESDGPTVSPHRRFCAVHGFQRTSSALLLSPPPETVKAIEPEHGDEAASLREQIAQHKNSDAMLRVSQEHRSVWLRVRDL